MSWFSRAALEYIGQAGFGYKFNALHDKESSDYGEWTKKMLCVMSSKIDRSNILVQTPLTSQTPVV